MLYIILGVIILYCIIFVVSIFNSNDTLQKLYAKYVNIPNNKNWQGMNVAFDARRYFGLDVKVAMRKGIMTDAYSIKDRIIIISEDVCYNNSIAAAAIVAHEVGHAVQHKNKSLLLGLVRFTTKFCDIFCRFVLPLLLAGAILRLAEINVEVGNILLIIALSLCGLNIIDNFLNIPLESGASRIGFRYLKDNKIISKKDYGKVKRLLSVASKTYMAHWLRTLLPIRRK